MLVKMLQLILDILIGFLILFTCIRSFVHAKAGQDIAGVTFGVAFLVLLVSKIVLIWVYFVTGFNESSASHINEYLWWYVALSYLPFAIGCFVSIFASGKLSSIVWAPAILLMGVVSALPFIEKLFPLIPNFRFFGPFIWLVAAVFMFATSIAYFFYNYKASDRFRYWMGIGFLLLAISTAMNIFSGSAGTLYLVAVVAQFAGFFIIFYEINHS